MSTRVCVAALLAFAAAVVVVPGAAAAAPSNDAFSTAVLSTAPFSDSVDVSEATLEGGEPSAWCWPLGGSVWYKLQPAADTVIRISTATNPYFERVVNVYRQTGAGIGGLSPIACGYPWDQSIARLDGGDTYFIQAGRVSWTSGGVLDLNVEVVPPPTNDDYADAASVNPLPYSRTESSLAATREDGEPMASCGPSTTNSYWYSFTAPSAGSYTVRTSSGTWPVIGLFRGGSLGTLTEVGCRSGGGSVITFAAGDGETTYVQISDVYGGNYGPITTSLEVAPSPVAQFWYGPGDPSLFDTVAFSGSSNDPGGNPIVEELYEFGDGTSAVGCCPQYIGGQPDAEHRYAKDGDYTVRVTATTSDGRSASYEQVIQVRTHDVAITRINVPQSASVGQTREITVGVSNQRYSESVRVDLYRSSATGFVLVGSLTQSVPVRKGGRTTDFKINYTFTGDDAALGSVNFKAIATIVGPRDALPTNNETVALPTRVR